MYVDSDYTTDTEDRKSMNGFLSKTANETVHWGAGKQNTVALFTCEAEYCDMSVDEQNLEWIRKCLEEARVPMKGPISPKSDNVSAISLEEAEQTPFASSKHIDVRAHCI